MSVEMQMDSYIFKRGLGSNVTGTISPTNSTAGRIHGPTSMPSGREALWLTLCVQSRESWTGPYWCGAVLWCYLFV